MTVPEIALAEPIGPADAPLLVLGPSLGTSALLWSRTLPALRKRYRVTAWDLPGHGASPSTVAPFTVGELADAVADAVAGPFLYAGVSLGGAAGIELLLRHPGLVTAAAIIASGAHLGEAAGWHERAAKVRAESTSSVVISSAQRWFAPGALARDPELTGRLLHVLQDADDESYALCCEALAVYDVRDRLGRIAAPVLAAWGEHDLVAPEEKARELADGVHDGRRERILGAAHLPPAEQPKAVAALLLDFFSALELT